MDDMDTNTPQPNVPPAGEKKSVGKGMGIAIVVIVALIAAGFLWWFFSQPSEPFSPLAVPSAPQPAASALSGDDSTGAINQSLESIDLDALDLELQGIEQELQNL